MGTNYFLEERPPCSTCGRGYPSRHIGKSSAGWCFALHVYPEKGIRSLEDWLPHLCAADAVIRDEYGKEHGLGFLLSCITRRSRTGPELSGPDNETWYSVNNAERGPNGLARSKLSRRCIAHGSGTWDCIVGEEDSW